MKKQPTLHIVDARRGGKRVAYRVKSVGANGETLQTSEVLNDKKAVKTHITAMVKCWQGVSPLIIDKTTGKKFS